MDSKSAAGNSGYYGNEFYFGYYDIPLQIEQGNLSVCMEQEGNSLVYRRRCNGDAREKILFGTDGQVLFNPVEPVHKPKEITTFFLIELEETLNVKPRETAEVMLTFPVEIGAVFFTEDKSSIVLDVFTLGAPKYTLYGEPGTGMICRYWESKAHTVTPSPDPRLAGVMYLQIKNTLPRWIEISRAVFCAHDLQIYYNQHLVCCSAYMRILSETSAETGFNSFSPQADM
ncbi:MAG TPA: hypothetical protein DCQ14_02725, partial [Firmicutes bacterium]|nr:hypothetical protein [Bacillota bacterium]